MRSGICGLLLMLALLPAPIVRADIGSDLPTADHHPNEDVRFEISDNVIYGDKGMEYLSPHSDTALWIGLRLQTRLDTFGGDLDEFDDLLQDKETTLRLRRGRFKGGGTLWWEGLQIYSEYDFPSNTLLDYRVTTTFDDWLSFRAGQWKSEYNRERVDSSGKQQLVERSIANYWFTVDRQQGLAASARLVKGTHLDTRVWLEALTGQGRGGGYEEGYRLWLGRVQWNPAGKQLPFSQSDVQRRSTPEPSIAVASVFGKSPYTRFSSSGGGSLPGFAVGDFELQQYLVETAVHYRGFGWQQELHWKRITDLSNGSVTQLVGGYAQLGTFVNVWCPCAPSPLEIVGRVAIVDPNRDLPDNTQREWTMGANWFFHGHRHKLTSDLSRLNYDAINDDALRTRFRFQWELSL